MGHAVNGWHVVSVCGDRLPSQPNRPSLSAHLADIAALLAASIALAIVVLAVIALVLLLILLAAGLSAILCRRCGTTGTILCSCSGSAALGICAAAAPAALGAPGAAILLAIVLLSIVLLGGGRFTVLLWVGLCAGAALGIQPITTPALGCVAVARLGIGLVALLGCLAGRLCFCRWQRDVPAVPASCLCFRRSCGLAGCPLGAVALHCRRLRGLPGSGQGDSRQVPQGRGGQQRLVAQGRHAAHRLLHLG